jgi:hypothetical protein
MSTQVFMPDSKQWQTLESQATTQDSKAIIGALKLVAFRLDELYDAVVRLDLGEDEDGNDDSETVG